MFQQLFYRGRTAATVYYNTLKNLYFPIPVELAVPFSTCQYFNCQKLIEAKQAVDLVKYRTYAVPYEIQFMLHGQS